MSLVQTKSSPNSLKNLALQLLRLYLYYCLKLKLNYQTWYGAEITHAVAFHFYEALTKLLWFIKQCTPLCRCLSNFFTRALTEGHKRTKPWSFLVVKNSKVGVNFLGCFLKFSTFLKCDPCDPLQVLSIRIVFFSVYGDLQNFIFDLNSV